MTKLDADAFCTVGPSDAIPEGHLAPHYLDDRKLRISIARIDGRLYAFDDLCTCADKGCALSGGLLDGTTVMCQCHGSRYDVTTGGVICGPATEPLTTYPVREIDHHVQIPALGDPRDEEALMVADQNQAEAPPLSMPWRSSTGVIPRSSRSSTGSPAGRGSRTAVTATNPRTSVTATRGSSMQSAVDTSTMSHRPQAYAFDFDVLPPLAMQKGLPLSELPSVAWLRAAVDAVRTGVRNQHEATVERAKRATVATKPARPTIDKLTKLARLPWQGLNETPIGRPQSLEDYRDQFNRIGLPPSAHVLFDDDAFAWWRVGGPNPWAIQRATDPGELTSDGIQSVGPFATDDLDSLVSSGRLVVADYRQALADLEPSDFPDGPKFAYKPTAWFGVPKGSRQLVPIAILPGDDGPLQYAPPAGQESWAWNAAKTIVASADMNHHEIICHLARTHLFIEPFIVATHLALPKHHPVSLLLRPHFEGTIFINWAAFRKLIATGGGVDRLLAGSLASSLNVAAESLTRITFDEVLVPVGFAARGFGGPVPFEYPYRDDALALWDAMHHWVGSYLAIFYPDDGGVQTDGALQRWSRLVRSQDGGRVTTFPELRSIETLVDAIAAIMFTASALHAAGNFPQATVTAYTPLAPGAGYTPTANAISAQSESEWLDLLPPLDMAAEQLRLTHALGSVHHTQLGRYRRRWFLPTHRNNEVQERLGSFTLKLGAVEAAINARNARLPLAFQYPYLLPSQIPQSINI